MALLSGIGIQMTLKCSCKPTEITRPAVKPVGFTPSEEVKRALEFLKSTAGSNYKKKVLSCLLPTNFPIVELLNRAQYLVPGNLKWRSLVFENAKTHVQQLNYKCEYHADVEALELSRYWGEHGGPMEEVEFLHAKVLLNMSSTGAALQKAIQHGQLEFCKYIFPKFHPFLTPENLYVACKNNQKHVFLWVLGALLNIDTANDKSISQHVERSLKQQMMPNTPSSAFQGFSGFGRQSGPQTAFEYLMNSLAACAVANHKEMFLWIANYLPISETPSVIFVAITWGHPEWIGSVQEQAKLCIDKKTILIFCLVHAGTYLQQKSSALSLKGSLEYSSPEYTAECLRQYIKQKLLRLDTRALANQPSSLQSVLYLLDLWNELFPGVDPYDSENPKTSEKKLDTKTNEEGSLSLFEPTLFDREPVSGTTSLRDFIRLAESHSTVEPITAGYGLATSAMAHGFGETVPRVPMPSAPISSAFAPFYKTDLAAVMIGLQSSEPMDASFSILEKRFGISIDKLIELNGIGCLKLLINGKHWTTVEYVLTKHQSMLFGMLHEELSLFDSALIWQQAPLFVYEKWRKLAFEPRLVRDCFAKCGKSLNYHTCGL